jgi:hypothetical protein
MQCPVCGAQNEATATFCDQCGSALRPPTSSPPTEQSVSANHAPWTAPQAQPSAPTPGNVTSPSFAPVAEHEARVYDAPVQSAAMTEASPTAPLPSSSTPYVVGTAPLPTSQTSTTAVLALVFGLLSWTFLPVIAGIGAIIAGHMARREFRNGATTGGEGLAFAGLVLGYLNLFAALAGCAIFALIFANI